MQQLSKIKQTNKQNFSQEPERQHIAMACLSQIEEFIHDSANDMAWELQTRHLANAGNRTVTRLRPSSTKELTLEWGRLENTMLKNLKA